MNVGGVKVLRYGEGGVRVLHLQSGDDWAKEINQEWLLGWRRNDDGFGKLTWQIMWMQTHTHRCIHMYTQSMCSDSVMSMSCINGGRIRAEETSCSVVWRFGCRYFWIDGSRLTRLWLRWVLSFTLLWDTIATLLWHIYYITLYYYYIIYHILYPLRSTSDARFYRLLHKRVREAWWDKPQTDKLWLELNNLMKACSLKHSNRNSQILFYFVLLSQELCKL